MKQLRLIPYFLLLLLGLTAYAAPPTTPLGYLTAMTHAHQTADFEQLYLFQQGEEQDAFRYRHATQHGKRYAQLLRLDATREELILRDESLSYFGEFQPFRLPSRQVLDHLPGVLYADFSRLNGYNLIDAGRSRIADRRTKVIHVIPQDEFRYQYQLWIDEETFLLLRADLLDRDERLLEQFRVLQSIVSDELKAIIEPINALNLPPLLPETNTHTMPISTSQWQPSWLPSGFEPSQSQQAVPNFLDNELLESRLYSDGLFSFTIYLVENKGVIFQDQFWRDGKTSIYSQTVGEKDIIIIGEIPLISARHILQEIRQNPPLVNPTGASQ